ncbi:hypothetical protein [Butyrivibrio proteoclasticus]|uniref:hypothetical protein n=1 Tax=Butyrivibrio proteoclasticus TaxID=43305 RepID=UPI000944AB37|nr:hypothetical protein [Butyrivibrio proteoclasticus]
MQKVESNAYDAMVIVGMLGHKLFIPLVAVADSGASVEGPELYCTRGGIQAIGIRTAEGFVLKKGAR